MVKEPVLDRARRRLRVGSGIPGRVLSVCPVPLSCLKFLAVRRLGF